MSRIGRAPIAVPAGVTVTIADGNLVTVKGPMGELTQSFNAALTIALEGANLTVTRPNDEKENRALHGLTRTLLANMVEGVTKGFSKKLEIVGVGYRVEKQGAKLVLGLGYSHPVVFEEANGIKFETPDSTTIIVKGIDKQAVGQMAAVIRAKRPPEPYLGKGIKYSGEHIRRKAGKTGK
ncbi:MAG: 50S ribosomal protein L6 [Clostridia bacterium]|nr:50S ribosomal protein L6 [Clostridia bacterium]MBQ8268493.1 50S ribosomal protein L6 [Clostridia bacterium]MBR2325309.1 50S ribosomal protein L6 [Clostridia bacterium]